jgi:hypothetical protein
MGRDKQIGLPHGNMMMANSKAFTKRLLHGVLKAAWVESRQQSGRSNQGPSLMLFYLTAPIQKRQEEKWSNGSGGISSKKLALLLISVVWRAFMKFAIVADRACDRGKCLCAIS